MRPVPRILLSLALTFAAVGLAEPRLPHPGRFPNEIGIAQGFVAAMLLFSWCKADAFGRGIPPPAGAPVLVALFTPIGIPYYFFRTRPWRSALLAIGKALAFYVLMTVLYAVCFYFSAPVA